jgi:hypothetical protein
MFLFVNFLYIFLNQLSKILILLFGIVWAQQSDFELITEEFNDSDLRTFIESKSFSFSPHFSMINNTQVSKITVALETKQSIHLQHNIYQKRNTEFIPVFSGSILITHNLLIYGGLSQFNSNGQNIQFLNSGVGLMSEKDFPYPWNFSISLNRLEGPTQFSIRAVSMQFKMIIQKLNFPFQIGMGKEMYTSRFFQLNDNFPSTLEGEINYVLFGKQFDRSQWCIVPQLRLHPKILGTSLKLIYKLG